MHNELSPAVCPCWRHRVSLGRSLSHTSLQSCQSLRRHC